MEMADSDQYFAYENRLASFRGYQHASKGRVSSATSRAPKVFQWPHKILSPVALAKAGFFFHPDAKHPDNVTCFLCNKSLDGWDENDNPLEEHLKHSPTCGWAIMAAIEGGYGNYGKVHPLDPFMIEARKATFAGRWPYESKKGFKCKTKKLVEGGWTYTPSLDCDDMTTCSYCHLALEGWASDDSPFDEHARRSPGCLFFALINQYPAPKKGRAKTARASKVSRLSVQSVVTVATAASDLASIADITADHDDSVMTTASTMTQGGKKTRAKKTTAAKARKTKAKKDESVDILEDKPQTEEVASKHAPRGRKRTSDAMEDSVITNAEAPAAKKRATKKKASTAADADSETVDAAPAKPATGRKKGRASAAKPTKTARKVSQASVRSQASTASLRGTLPDDEELERQLEADLKHYDSNAENVTVEQPPAPAKGRPKKGTTLRKTSAKQKKTSSEAFTIFDPTPIVPDEAEIDADLDALHAETKGDPSAPDTLVVPKKGRKTGTRKVSKQTKKTKETVPEADPAEQAVEAVVLPEPDEPQEVDQAEQEEEPERGMNAEAALADDPDLSTGTVITKPASRPSLEKRKGGRPSKRSTSSQAAPEAPQPRRTTRLSRQSEVQPEVQPVVPITRDSLPARKSITRKPVPVPSQPPAPVPASIPTRSTPIKTQASLPLQPPSSASRLLRDPATPGSHSVPSRRASQAVISPSQTPQSSDVENHPPSLQPAASLIPSKRVVLAPVPNHQQAQAQTPQRSSSPAKRNNNNVIAGLQSTAPWHPADLDVLFSSPSKSHADDGKEDKENGGRAVARLLRKGSELTSPEKRMTVEEWIYHNAGLAEQKLKRECEAMVSAFEREGGRAMEVLEGLIVD
ncbi:hypothetical protein VTI74DRAFT_11093 [Chaetomium olivicolor]